MDIIEPKRLNSLGSFKIHIKESPPGFKELVLDNQYGFTTIADLKREIWIQHDGNPEWSPNRIWIAQEIENNMYKPLDMSWTDQTTLSEGVPSPFDFDGNPDSRLVDSEGNRKTIYPLLNEGLLLDSIFKGETNIHIVIWSLESIVKNLVEKHKILLEKPGILSGYIQMYFPKIQTVKEILEPEDESYNVARDYINHRNERLEDINKLLKDSKVKKSEPFRLRHLRRWKGIIPKYVDESKSLDILFYEFKVSENVPFLRYFPMKGHGEPLLKLATGISGFPIISDKDMLATFLDEEPNLDFGPVMIAKIPFTSLSTEVRATRNVALTIYWLEDGSSNITLEAPRRDMPLEFGVLEEAKKLLKNALLSIGYKEPLQIKLEELSAAYRIEVSADKMNQKELIRRIPFFSPFLEEASFQEKSNTKVHLKWKAVNNYEQEGAVFSYLTKRILDEDIDMGMDTTEQIQKYIRGIMDEFGRSEADAKRLFDDWFRRRTEVVPTSTDPVRAHNTGVDIEIDISHPIYFISFVGIDSETTFKRLISVMTAYLYYSNKEVVDEVPITPIAPAVNIIPAKAKLAANINPDMHRWMDLLGDEEEEEEQEEKEEQKEERKAPTDAKIHTLQPLQEWYKAQLDLFDEKLFGYSQTDKTVKVYSRTCQASSARQPNVLVPEQLDTLIKEYGDTVEWVFLPPPDNIILDIKKLSNKELINEMVKRGFNDIIDEKGKPTKLKDELLEIFEKFLCEEPGLQGQFCRIINRKEQESDKPIWFVARAGSEKANYYICAEYWCVRDNKPLVPSEFKSTRTHNGSIKEADSCPFCGGRILEDIKNPKRGETVIKRKKKPGKGEIHEVVGYIDNIHPSNFALPCCFIGPTVSQMKPPPNTEALPKDRRKNGDDSLPIINAEPKEEEENTDLLEDAALTKVLKTMRTQYILGYEKRQLEPGRIGLCPPALDDILGQNGSLSVIKAVGVAQHFKPTAKLFVRFGLGNKGASPGLSFLELLGFYLGNLQRAGQPHVKGTKVDIPSVYTSQAVLKLLVVNEINPKDEDMKFLVNFRRAFERANYGNLVHEFVGNSDKLTTGQIQQFAKEQGFDLNKNPSIRPHVIRFANAWFNFISYLKDESAIKDLKHFEQLFATPNVIFPNGLIPIIFEGTMNEDGMSVKIKCPEYGISEFSKTIKPPLAFIWYDKTSNVYEPIIYVEATSKKDRKDKQKYIVMTTFHESYPKYIEIDKSVQDTLSDFIKQFLSFEEGCGRYENPPHPWMPDLESNTVPRLGNLLKLKLGSEVVPESILRDRSNRLVGILYKISQSDIPVYIPALEDGSMGLQLKSLYDTQSLPMPSIETLFNLLTDKKLPFVKIASLKPVEILVHEKEMRFCAIRTQCNAIIPFAPIKIDYAESIKNPHPLFIELMKKGNGAKPIVMLPWNEDIRFLRSGYEPLDNTMDIVSEAVVEEAYHYLRISLSEWLNTRDGNHTLKQLKALKDAHLPLYEKRRRGDILLEPLIHNWLDTSAHTSVIPTLSLLRRNCIIESKDTCTTSPMCSFIGNECKIHTGTSEAIPDIKVYFTSRIIDEIMRYSNRSAEILGNKVPKIRMPIGTITGTNYILTSKSKIQHITEDLNLNFVPKDAFSAGLSYPEDIHDDDMGKKLRAEYIDIPNDWKKNGFSRFPFNPSIDRLKASLIEWTSKDYKYIVNEIIKVRKARKINEKDVINWNEQDWLCFSSAFSTDVIITRYSYETDTTKVYKWLRGGKTENYCIVFYVDSPEVLLSTKKSLHVKDLPLMFQRFFDSSTPMTWELI
jgi:hypothetical protein